MRKSDIRYLLLKSLWTLLNPVIYLMLFVLFLFALFGMFAATVERDGFESLYALIVSVSLFIFFWWVRRRLPKALQKTKIPERFGLRLAPCFVPLFYTLTLVLLIYFFANLSYEGAALIPQIGFPWYWALMFVGMIGGNIEDLFILPLAIALIKMLVGIVKTLKATPRAERRFRPFAWALALIIVFTLLIHFVREEYNSRVVGYDRNVVKIYDEIKPRNWVNDETSLAPFAPFAPDSLLVKIESPTLAIDSEHPKLHGALALYPIYAAAVEALYRNSDADNIRNIVKGGTSPKAFAALLNGEADIVFMIDPSAKQLAEAEARGLTLEITPLGYEAFVFFVSRENAVNDLTHEQIRAIYSRQITRWREVGGDRQRILPFQRPEGSGSQTAMERVMGEVALTAPVREEYQETMGGIVNRVADYRNYGNSIGYSFRYYVNSMFKHDGVKIISIGGVAPEPDNISNGAYPFVYPLVAVTSADNTNPNIRKLLDWFLSEQGQDLIERVGYTPLEK